MFSVYQGDTFSFPIFITDANRVPVNLTGVTVEFSLGVTGNVITEVSEGVTVTVDGPNGKISIAVTDTTMGEFPVGSYWVWTRVTYPDGTKETEFNLSLTVMRGMLRV